MDKLKNILKSDTPTGNEPASTRGAGGSSGISGQGTHFPGKDETTTGTTVTGTDPQTRGPADVSAAPASSTAAATTSGPEQGGSGHINTTSTSSALPSTQTTEPTAVNTSGAHESTGGAQSYTISSAASPQTQSSVGGTGSAAIGETSTYSSSPLSHGNPTSSVVDPSSSDPLTYKKPESGAGVGTGAAATAASLAFAQGEERKKETMSGHENPYRASSLDPRVDGLPKGSDVSSRDTGLGTTSGGSAGAGAGAGAGLAGAGASTAYNNSRAQENAAAPSTLTTTVDPANRSAEYGASTESKGLGSSSTGAPSLPPVEQSEQRPSMVGKVLGAVGLGGVAGALGVSGGDSSAVADTPEQPTTTTGLSSYTAPTQQGAPTSHHRKESIPTTAYPSATFDSPRAINQPIGGAGSPVVHGDQHASQGSHTGRDVATGMAAGGAATGAAAIGAHEHNKQTLGDNVASDSSGILASAHHATTVGSDTTSAVPPGTYTGGLPGSGETGSTGLTTGGTTSTEAGTVGHGTAKAIHHHPATTATTSTTERADERDHTARDTAVGAGAGAAAVGAGAYGAHEYSKREADKAEAEAAKQQAARDKELEKQHKAEEKAAAKEERHHQKELEKEERQHQKEAEKKERQHQREVEREEALLAKQREEEEEQRRIRQEREKLAGAVGYGGTETAAEAGERGKEKEKKPSIFKRIFKRRKNKETGEDEEYSSNEEEATENKDAAHRYGDRLVGAGTSTYEQKSEGAPKPSYEHLRKDEPSVVTSAGGADTGASAQHRTSTEAITGLPYDASKDPDAARRLSEHTHGSGVGHYDKKDAAAVATAGTAAAGTTAAMTEGAHSSSKDVDASRPLGGDSYGTTTGTTTADAATTGTSTTGTHDKSVAPATLDSTGTTSQQPAEAVTGIPAASSAQSKDMTPSTTENTGSRTRQHLEAVTGIPATSSKDRSDHPDRASGVGSTTATGAGAGVGAGTGVGTGAETEPNVNTNFTLGEMQEGQGFGEKIKEALHLGGSKKE